jgi:predicted alternative tryptophan synthase beta-subunit
VWTMSNYHAIKAIEKNKGHLVVYEAFLSHPKKEWARLSKFFGIKSKSVPKVKEGNFFKFKKKDLAMLERRVKTYGVEKEFAYVVNAVKIHGIDYRNPTL